MALPLDSETQLSHAQDKILEEIFAEQGTLAQKITGYRLRAGQIEMAQTIAKTLAASRTLIAEAGTGTGKTFAYLVPALLWGGKVIISTGTKTLQDQLFDKDLPMVRHALAAPVTLALLKGRANYVCHYHLERMRSQGRLTSRQEVSDLRKISRFAQITQTGDKAELADVPEHAPIWHLVTSTKDNCLGVECPDYKKCFVMQARRAAQQADVVVVNHHLFFADSRLRDEGVTDLLPTANTVIFDEAHQLPEVATLFFGETVTTAQVLELARDLLTAGLSHARDAAHWPDIIAPLEQATRELRLAIAQDNLRLNAAELSSDHPLYIALAQLLETIDKLAKFLETQTERAQELEQCWRRLIEIQQRLQTWSAEKTTQGSVRWLEAMGHSLRLHCSPLSVAEEFTRQRAGTPRAWIFTSATLAVRGDFSHFAQQLGLSDADARVWPSPFDYGRQALLYVPQQLPAPFHFEYTNAVIDAALPILRASGGRAFVLCTTLKAVQRAAERLREQFVTQGLDFPLLVQGETSRGELLKRFRSLGNAVLVGSQSFWEGVDVRGQALSLVIIDKLPFAPPDDPVLAARLEVMARKGGNPFMDYQLPQAVISLKQGAGRLIRDESDWGVLMICDPRLISKPYGRRIWQSLPAFARTRDEQEVLKFFQTRSICSAPAIGVEDIKKMA